MIIQMNKIIKNFIKQIILNILLTQANFKTNKI